MFEGKPIRIFFLVAFGLPWLTALCMKVGGITYGSTISLVLVAGVYMMCPALAAWMASKAEGTDLYANGWNLKGIRKVIFVFLPICLILFLSLFFLLEFFLGNYLQLKGFGRIITDQSAMSQNMLDLVGQKIKDKSKLKPLMHISPWILLFSSIFNAIVVGAIVNLPFTFGEEYGWRGYLLQRWRIYGAVKSALLIGLFWGVWHWPIILMGHNYPAHPILGCLVMIFFCVSMALPLAWMRLRSHTILAPSAFHGMINGIGALPMVFVAGSNELLGSLAGLCGAAAGFLLTGLILLYDRAFIRVYQNLFERKAEPLPEPDVAPEPVRAGGNRFVPRATDESGIRD